MAPLSPGPEAARPVAGALFARGFIVQGVARRLEPTTEDPFIADLEPARGGDGGPAAPGAGPRA